MRLATKGTVNEDLLGILRANVREPVQVVGDVYALMACNDIGSRRLCAMMREFGLTGGGDAGRPDHRPEPGGDGGGYRQAAGGKLDELDAGRRV